MSLLPHHRALLDASAIAPEVAEARGYRSVTDASELPAFGFPPGQVRGLAPCLPGLLVPIHDAEGRLALHQLRPDREYRNGTGKPAKYVTPKGRQLVLDVPKALGDGFRDAARPLCHQELTSREERDAPGDLEPFGDDLDLELLPAGRTVARLDVGAGAGRLGRRARCAAPEHHE